MKCMEVKMI